MTTEDIFSESKELPPDRLEQLQNLVNKYKDLEIEIARIEEELKKKQEDFERVARVSIPSILNEVGLSELKLSTGEKVEIKDKLKASVADKNYYSAFNNMVASEGGDEDALNRIKSLFKIKAVVEASDETVLETLIENDIPYEVKREIPWQTLNKYCREKLASGQEIPEGITVFQFQETKIK